LVLLVLAFGFLNVRRPATPEGPKNRLSALSDAFQGDYASITGPEFYFFCGWREVGNR
jgi:hypothetical protein